MKITTDNITKYTDLFADLYTAVDAKDADGVVRHVADDVTFKLGNFDQLTGRTIVKDANVAFFDTISGMHHTITGIWESGPMAFCEGLVRYTRKDLSEYEVPFATRLEIRNNEIKDYRIFVDISEL